MGGGEEMQSSFGMYQVMHWSQRLFIPLDDPVQFLAMPMAAWCDDERDSGWKQPIRSARQGGFGCCRANGRFSVIQCDVKLVCDSAGMTAMRMTDIGKSKKKY